VTSARGSAETARSATPGGHANAWLVSCEEVFTSDHEHVGTRAVDTALNPVLSRTELMPVTGLRVGGSHVRVIVARGHHPPSPHSAHRSTDDGA
jgi:hypothetical protein